MTKKMERLWVYFLKEQVYVYGIQSQDILGLIFEEKNLKKKIQPIIRISEAQLITTFQFVQKFNSRRSSQVYKVWFKIQFSNSRL